MPIEFFTFLKSYRSPYKRRSTDLLLDKVYLVSIKQIATDNPEENDIFKSSLTDPAVWTRDSIGGYRVTSDDFANAKIHAHSLSNGRGVKQPIIPFFDFSGEITVGIYLQKNEIEQNYIQLFCQTLSGDDIELSSVLNGEENGYLILPEIKVFPV
jgi:hypothetical protein